MHERLRACLLFCFNLCYDLFCAAVNVSDVASDVVICIQFYVQEQLTFFWLCIAVFAIAQISYAVLFTVLYGLKNRYPHKEYPYVIACFLCILPFAQVVPLIVWIGSFKFVWFDKLCGALGLHLRDDVNRKKQSTQDPLKNYILTKAITHGGFMIESVVESVPQSIIQMVAIVVYNQTSIINIVSLAISIISVSSRGLVLSYSIHRPTFVFNFTCFIVDVFRVFCVVSWLFFPDPSSTYQGYLFFLATPVDDPYTYFWWCKEIVVVCMALLGGLLLFAGGCEDMWVNKRSERAIGLWRSTFRDFGIYLLLAVFGLIVFVPTLIVLEAAILSFLPLLVFRSLSNTYAHSAELYRDIFDWVCEKDFSGRVRAFNRHYARQYLMGQGYREVDNWQSRSTYVDTSRMYLHSVKVMQTSDEQFSLIEGAKKNKKVIFHKFARLFKALSYELKRVWDDGYYIIAVGHIYLCICLPVACLSAVYSLIYPLLCFASTPWASMGLLQQLFSLITFVLFGILILLSPSVLRFYRCTSSLEMCYSSADRDSFDRIKQAYNENLTKRVKENTGRLAILVANANANAQSELVHHIVAVIPEITKFAGFSGAFAINVEQFIGTSVFRQLAQENLHPQPDLGGGDESSRLSDDFTLDLSSSTLTSKEKGLVPVAPPLNSLAEEGSPLFSALQAIGDNSQIMLNELLTSNHVIGRINAHYQDETESVVPDHPTPEAESSSLITRDEHGRVTAATFHQKSWQHKIQTNPFVPRRTEDDLSSSESLPTSHPNMARWHTA